MTKESLKQPAKRNGSAADSFLLSLRGIHRLGRVEAAVVIATLAVLVFSCFAYNYFDSWYLTIWSVNFAEAVYHGNPLLVFSYNANLPETDFLKPTVISLMSTAPRALWNLPLWYLQHFKGVDISIAPKLLAWGKMFYVFILYFLLRETWKLAHVLTRNVSLADKVTVLSLTSSTVFIAIGYTGQNDVFWMWLSLWGIRMLVQDKFGWFVLLSALAVSFKPFFLIAYLAILLMVERRFLRLVFSFVLGASIAAVQFYVSTLAPHFRESVFTGNLVSDSQSLLFGLSVKTPHLTVSVFLMALLSIYVYALLSKRVNFAHEKDVRRFVLTVFLVYFVFLACSKFAFYRLVVLLPWVFLLMYLTKREMVLVLTFLTTLASNALFAVLLACKAPLFDLVACRNSVVFPPPHTVAHTYQFSFEALEFLQPHLTAGALFASLTVFTIFLVVAVLVSTNFADKVYQGLKSNDTVLSSLLRSVTYERLLVLRGLAPFAWIAFSFFVFYA